MDTYKSRTYTRADVRAAYIRCWGEEYKFCEVNTDRKDIRQGTINANLIPESIRIIIQEHQHIAPCYVEVNKTITLAMGPSPHRWRERSRTLPGIADAMAEQWGDVIENNTYPEQLRLF